MNCESRKGQDDAEIRLDWNKVYSKEMSFKTFADKWMPYIDLESAAKAVKITPYTRREALFYALGVGAVLVLCMALAMEIGGILGMLVGRVLAAGLGL